MVKSLSTHAIRARVVFGRFDKRYKCVQNYLLGLRPVTFTFTRALFCLSIYLKFRDYHILEEEHLLWLVGSLIAAEPLYGSSFLLCLLVQFTNFFQHLFGVMLHLLFTFIPPYPGAQLSYQEHILPSLKINEEENEVGSLNFQQFLLLCMISLLSELTESSLNHCCIIFISLIHSQPTSINVHKA